MTVIDSSVWVSRLMTIEVHHAVSAGWISRLVAGGSAIELPVSVLAEVSGAVARRTGSRETARSALEGIMRLPNIILFDIDEQLAKLAADIASRVRMKGMDSIFAALAISLSVPLFTWDREQFQRGRSLVDVRNPD